MRRTIELLVDEGHDVVIAAPQPRSTLEHRGWEGVRRIVIGPARRSSADPRRAFGWGVRRAVFWFLLAVVARRQSEEAWWSLGKQSERLFGLAALHAELERGADLVVVEDLLLLPAILSRRAPVDVLLDLRDDRTVQFSHIPFWRGIVGIAFEGLLDWAGPQCRSVITVSEGLRTRFEVMTKRPVDVVRSIPDVDAGRAVLARLTSSPIRMVHHGRVGLSRKLHRLIEVAQQLGPEFSLDLYLVGSRFQKARLRHMCRKSENVRIMPPVDFEDIHAMLEDYDIGVMLFEPFNENLRNILPNKFFEFINAGLAVASGPSPEIERIVEEFGCGVISEDFSVESMVHVLSGLTPKAVDAYRERSLIAASALSWIDEREKLRRLLGSA